MIWPLVIVWMQVSAKKISGNLTVVLIIDDPTCNMLLLMFFFFDDVLCFLVITILHRKEEKIFIMLMKDMAKSAEDISQVTGVSKSNVEKWCSDKVTTYFTGKIALNGQNLAIVRFERKF